jgi:hypothetical protein
MTTFAGTTPSTRGPEARIRLAVPVVLGAAIVVVAVVGMPDGRRGEVAALTRAAPASQVRTSSAGHAHRATTTASEQYRAWYTRPALAAKTSAGDQYRTWYTHRP